MTEKSTSDNSLNPKRKSFLLITIVTTQIMSTKEKKRKKILAVVTSDSQLFSQKKKTPKVLSIKNTYQDPRVLLTVD